MEASPLSLFKKLERGERMSELPDKRHPANDALARLMDWLGLSFGLGLFWIAFLVSGT
jgi:hypothetical protein